MKIRENINIFNSFKNITTQKLLEHYHSITVQALRKQIDRKLTFLLNLSHFK